MTTITSTAIAAGAPPSEPRAYTETELAAARQASRLWGWVLAGGVVSMLVGVAILSIRWNVDRLALFTGLVFAIRGITDIVTSGSRPHRVAAIVGGLLGILAGIVAVSWPGPTLFVIATVTGIWLVVWGMISVVGALFVRGPLWGLWLVGGIAAVPLGAWALAHPGATLAVLVAVVGFWALIGGLMEIFAAFEVRRLPETMEATRASSRRAADATGQAADRPDQSPPTRSTSGRSPTTTA